MTSTIELSKRAAVAFVLLSLGTCAVPAAWANPPSVGHIGVYDSRAVAIAYAGSPAFRELLADLRATQKKARDEGDRDTVERLEKTGRALQDKLHRQGFGTDPVDDLLAGFAEALAQVKAEAQVAELVSRWDAASLARHRNTRQVDVTRALVERITTDQRQRKAAMDIVSKKPMK